MQFVSPARAESNINKAWIKESCLVSSVNGIKGKVSLQTANLQRRGC